ncbi:MAG TPA: diaminopimelate decarboxylase [Solirubrobacteraceae bacterium]|jgi:diaminopimelate decarboxylase|nr:diaminopimelate decarboxylase [Solirubrobacteraceae bacterium]
MATGTVLSHVFPLGSRLNERGHVEVGGCDTIDLAREFGTPAYVVAEDDLRARAQAHAQAGRDAGHEDFHVVFASKAFPCTAVLSLFAEEGLWCDVASGGELHLALNAGFVPERILMHGNAKSETELRMALKHGVGLIVIDNFDEIDRLGRLTGAGGSSSGRPDRHASRADADQSAHAPTGRPAHAPVGTGPHAARSSRIGDGLQDHRQEVLIRATPDVRGDTHEKISTGQADSKFGFAMADVPAAIARVREVPGLSLQGIHAHIGSQLLELEPFRREVAALAQLGEFPVWDLGGGLGVAYTEAQRPPEIEEWVGTLVGTAHGAGITPATRILVEPGRALTANAGVTLYTVESVKRNVSTWVAVDGGMSDNLRPMLYGATYEAHIADRLGGEMPCVLAGKHCESGDAIVRSALLDDPKPGDIVLTPTTGAYGFAMASNYNGVPRPPVLFCKDGDARVVVRRETFDDLTARDVH